MVKTHIYCFYQYGKIFSKKLHFYEFLLIPIFPTLRSKLQLNKRMLSESFCSIQGQQTDTNHCPTTASRAQSAPAKLYKLWGFPRLKIESLQHPLEYEVIASGRESRYLYSSQTVTITCQAGRLRKASESLFSIISQSQGSVFESNLEHLLIFFSFTFTYVYIMQQEQLTSYYNFVKFNVTI